MKRILIFSMLMLSSFGFSQEVNIEKLEQSKIHIQAQIKSLNDSISVINKLISELKMKELQNKFNHSTLTSKVRKGANLRESPTPISIGGAVERALNFADKVTLLSENGAKTVLVPMENLSEISTLPTLILGKTDVPFYGNSQMLLQKAVLGE